MRATRWPDLNTSVEWTGRLHLKQPRLARVWAEYFGRIPWEWFVTLTFDPKAATPAGRERAAREAFWWCGQTSRVLRRALGWAFAPERRPSGMWHVHALLVGGLTRKDLETPRAVWKTRNGFADIRPVTDSQGAVLYTTKQAALTGEVVLSDTLIRYRDSLAVNAVIDLYPKQPSGAQ